MSDQRDAWIKLATLSPLIVLSLIEGRRMRRAGRHPHPPGYGLRGMLYRPPPGWWWDAPSARYRARDDQGPRRRHRHEPAYTPSEEAARLWRLAPPLALLGM